MIVSFILTSHGVIFLVLSFKKIAWSSFNLSLASDKMSVVNLLSCSYWMLEPKVWKFMVIAMRLTVL